MPSKDWYRIQRIVEYIRKEKKDLPFIKVSNKENISLQKVYMLAQQISHLCEDIKYKKGKFIYNGG